MRKAGNLKWLPVYFFENNKYIYSYTDHLGNVRLSYFKNSTGSAEVLEENNYYPFGMKHEGYNNALIGNPAYKYQYNGKEYQTETGWNDYGARMYMADIGRWGVVDPLAEKTRRWTPYVYTGDNPLRFIDPDGRTWGDPKDQERLINSVNNRIDRLNKNNADIQAKIDKGGVSEKKLTKLNAELAENNKMIGNMNQTLKDIKTIADAKEVFYLTGPSSSGGETHGVIKATKEGKERINIEGSDTSLHIHEIRHVGQSYEGGGLKFNSRGQLLNAAKVTNGKLDLSQARGFEINAYQIQHSFSPGTTPIPATSLDDINETSLMNIKSSDGTVVYEKLQSK